MIVLDASVLIAYLSSADPHHEAAVAMLRRAATDDVGANSLTLAEVLMLPTRDGQLAVVRAALRDLGIAELPFPVDTADRLAQLSAATGLKMPDCCVLLTAEDSRAAIASFDDRLIRAATARHLAIHQS